MNVTLGKLSLRITNIKFLLSVVAMLLLTTSISSAQPTTLINESFSSCTNMEKIKGGTFNCSNGKYVLTGAATTAPLGNIGLHKTSITGNYTVTADLTATSSTGAWDDSAVIFAYIDANNYYFVALNESDNTTTNGIFKVTNGTAKELANLNTKFSAGTAHTISVTVLNGKITVTKGTSTVGSVTISGSMSGRVGVGAYNNNASFDNLKVTTGTFTPVSAAFIGQSLMHRPGGAGSQILGKNLFYYFLEWGKGDPNTNTSEAHWTISGAGLQEHMNNADTDALIAKGLDYFVMGEGTRHIWTRGTTEQNARILGDKARQAGSVPVLYIPPPQKPGTCTGTVSQGLLACNPSEVMKAYMQVASNLGIQYVPVAYAIGEMTRISGASAVYEDDVHINAPAQFLAGCVTWATLTQTPADQIDYKGNTDGITSSQKSTLIGICKDTITRYPSNAQLLSRN
jgi:hypothetical protein